MEKNKLRSGYTTGTCAAAAAWAAVRLLCSGTKESPVSVLLPGGRRAAIQVVHFTAEKGSWAMCSVKKDAGDDPDVTNGTLICAKACLAGQEDPGQPCYTSDRYPGVYVTGGEGVGIVTKKGLSCPVGHYAINPVPREMILEAAFEARCCYGRPDERIIIEISIPEGKELAGRTFNPALGITGGISVLGTTGIVNPMSENALLETIRLDIRVRASEGRRILAAAPGNYGERFLREEFGLDMSSFVKCSNYIGDTFRMMKEEKIDRVLLAGHLGKLIKVAGGVMNTHSKYGDRRMEILADCARKAGLGPEAADRLHGMNTTDEAAEFLEREGCLRAVMDEAAGQVKKNLEDGFAVKTEVVLFNQEKGLLAATEGAAELTVLLKAAACEQSAVIVKDRALKDR